MHNCVLFIENGLCINVYCLENGLWIEDYTTIQRSVQNLKDWLVNFGTIFRVRSLPARYINTPTI